MAQQTIGIGSAPNDGTGDPARTAFNKINENFTELYGYTSTTQEQTDNDTSNATTAFVQSAKAVSFALSFMEI